MRDGWTLGGSACAAAWHQESRSGCKRCDCGVKACTVLDGVNRCAFFNPSHQACQYSSGTELDEKICAAIEEAAQCDGANRFQATLMILPLVAPGIGAFLVLCILFAWNDFLFATIIGSGGAKTPRVCIGVAGLKREASPRLSRHSPPMPEHMHGTCMEQWSDGAAPATSLPTSDGIALKSGS